MQNFRTVFGLGNRVQTKTLGLIGVYVGNCAVEIVTKPCLLGPEKNFKPKKIQQIDI
jgi:hypothetical protein